MLVPKEQASGFGDNLVILELYCIVQLIDTPSLTVLLVLFLR